MEKLRQVAGHMSGTLTGSERSSCLHYLLHLNVTRAFGRINYARYEKWMSLAQRLLC